MSELSDGIMAESQKSVFPRSIYEGEHFEQTEYCDDFNTARPKLCDYNILHRKKGCIWNWNEARA